MIRKILRFFLFWLVLSIIMVVSWSMGSFVGNEITQTSPPPVNNPSTAFIFLFVCLFNSLLVSFLILFTRHYTRTIRSIVIVVFCFVIQFLLAQMETYFFAGSLGISPGQIASILIAGLVMVVATITMGIVLMDKMLKPDARIPWTFELTGGTKLILPLILLACVAYPLIYLTFGYYVAWQNESLRIFYTQSDEMKPFVSQVTDAFTNGIYAFQILRGFVWVMVSLPLIVMLRHLGRFQYVFVGLITSLLPAIQLFIPNPYMPAEVAITHFIETALSNFLWGVVVTAVANRYVPANTLPKTIGTIG